MRPSAGLRLPSSDSFHESTEGGLGQTELHPGFRRGADLPGEIVGRSGDSEFVPVVGAGGIGGGPVQGAGGPVDGCPRTGAWGDRPEAGLDRGAGVSGKETGSSRREMNVKTGYHRGIALLLVLLAASHCSRTAVENRSPEAGPPRDRGAARSRAGLEELETAYVEGIGFQNRGAYGQADTLFTVLIARIDSLFAGPRLGTSVSRSLSHLRSKAAFFRNAARISAERKRREEELNLRRAEIEDLPLWITEEGADIRRDRDPASAVVTTLSEGDVVYRAGGGDDWVEVRIPVDSLSLDSVSTLETLEARYLSGWVPEALVSEEPIPKLTSDQLRERASRREVEAAASRIRSRREEYVRSHPDQPADFLDAILAGEVALGMSMEMVGASLGPPGDVKKTISAAGTIERWTYVTVEGALRSLTFDDGVLTVYEE